MLLPISRIFLSWNAFHCATETQLGKLTTPLNHAVGWGEGTHPCTSSAPRSSRFRCSKRTSPSIFSTNRRL